MSAPPTIVEEIERYLRTGDTDPLCRAWPGGVVDAGRHAHADIRGALVREVRRLAAGLSHEPVPDGVGVDFTRSKVEPMVRGLFPRAEQDTVLAVLEKSVVYVTSATIESILMEHDYDCKRHTLGLRDTRRKEWLLEIEFRQRETFAYSCEAYARVIARAKSPSERKALANEYGTKVRISEERVDPTEVASIVAEAASARNGWKVILKRCAPRSKPRTALQQLCDVSTEGA